jgi:hypothetical protein
MRRSVWIGSLSAATLAITAALVGGGAVTTANAVDPVPQPAGQLVYSSDALGDTWSYTDAGTTTTQSLTTAVGSCIVAPSSSGGPLVTISGNAFGVPGLASHSLGVTQTATSANCNRVNINKVKVGTSNVTQTETLTLALNNAAGGTFNTPAFGASKATSATLDMEYKDDAKVQADLYDGATLVGTYKVFADEDARPASLPADWGFCKTRTEEDGYDSTGTKDNCPWTLTPNLNGAKYFDKVVLTPLAGWFSVEGGGDWGVDAAAHRTTFDIVNFYDGTLACNASTGSVSSDGSVTAGTVNRLANGDPAASCQLIPYTLTAGDGSLTFHKPLLGTQSTAQFQVDLTRTITPDPITHVIALPIPQLQVNWEDAAVNSGVATVVDLTSCPAALYNPAAGTFDYAGRGADQSPLAGWQYACQMSEQQDPQIDGSIVVTSHIYVTGDMIIGGVKK